MVDAKTILADLAAANDSDVTTCAIQNLTWNRDRELIRGLLSMDLKFSLERRDNTGYTPLMAAVNLADIEIVTALLEAKACANVTDETNRSVIQLCALRCPKERKTICGLLLAAGGRFCHGVFQAAYKGNVSSIKQALVSPSEIANKKDDIKRSEDKKLDAKQNGVKDEQMARVERGLAFRLDGAGHTVLHYAAANGHVHYLQSALALCDSVLEEEDQVETDLGVRDEGGRSVKAETKVGKIASMTKGNGVKGEEEEKSKKRKKKKHMTKKQRCVRRRRRRAVGVVSKNGDTALLLAAKNGHRDCLELLMKHSTKTTKLRRDKFGRDLLMCAARFGHTDVVKWLHGNKASLDRQSDKDAESPLTCAAYGGHITCIEYLLRNGAQHDDTIHLGVPSIRGTGAGVDAEDESRTCGSGHGPSGVGSADSSEGDDLDDEDSDSEEEEGDQGPEGYYCGGGCRGAHGTGGLASRYLQMTTMVEYDIEIFHEDEDEEDEEDEQPAEGENVGGSDSEVEEPTQTPEHEGRRAIGDWVRSLVLGDAKSEAKGAQEGEDEDDVESSSSGRERMFGPTGAAEASDDKRSSPLGHEVIWMGRGDGKIDDEGEADGGISSAGSHHFDNGGELARDEDENEGKGVAAAENDRKSEDTTEDHDNDGKEPASASTRPNRMNASTRPNRMKWGLMPLLFYALEKSELEISTWLHQRGCAWENDLTKELKHTGYMRAAVGGSLECLEWVSKHCKSSVLAKTVDGCTALHYAVVNDNLRAAKMLIKMGARDTVDVQGNNLVLSAAKEGSLWCLQWLLARQPRALEISNRLNQTPLLLAVACNQLVTAQWLIKQKANVNVRDVNGHDVLFMAAKGGSTEIVTWLLEKKLGGGIDARDAVGRTPLILAASCNHLKTVQLLLDRGADIAAMSICNLTPMHWASWLGCDRVVQCLIERKANVSSLSLEEESCLHLAAKCSHPAMALATAKVLVQNGTPPAAVDCRGKTPAYVASLCGNLPLLKWLVTKGLATVTETDNNCIPMLFATAETKHSHVVKYLVEQKAPLVIECNSQDRKGKRKWYRRPDKSEYDAALLHAIAHKSVPIIAYLAGKNDSMALGETAYKEAGGDAEVCEVLDKPLREKTIKELGMCRLGLLPSLLKLIASYASHASR